MPGGRNDSSTEASPVAEDYLKLIWQAGEWDASGATVSGLARRLGTTRATVSGMLRRLSESGLVTHERYGRIELTSDGSRVALAMVRRHRLIETFLVRQLGYAWDEVHDEADRLEHAVSDTFVARLDTLLGHPDADPHGDPIPGPDGTVVHPSGARILADAGLGDHRVVRVSDSDPDHLRRLAAIGVVPGATIRTERGAAGVALRSADGTRHPLDASLTRAIFVVEVPDHNRG